MSVDDFQRALCDMTLDPVLAGAVRRAGAPALSAYALTPREQDRLTATARQPGMSLTCSLARANRFAPIAEAFPLTCSLLKPVLRELLDELWSVQRPDSYQLSGEIDAFADHLRRKLSQHQFPSSYVAEVFDYECAVWTLIQPLMRGERTVPAQQPQSAQMVTVRFAHDPTLLLSLLERDEVPPAGLPAGNYAVQLTLGSDGLEMFVRRTDSDAAV
jgi:hypothetical protein